MTLWALARVLLRAVVSIACMVWIFKAVLGIDGGIMRKISLYTFVTTFCIVPVTDWGAFIQRVIGRILLAGLLFKLFQLLKQPLFIAALVGVLIWSPDTIAWIFIKIGDIELRVLAMLLTAVMPELFGTAGGAYTSWEQIWSAGLGALPADMLDVNQRPRGRANLGAGQLQLGVQCFQRQDL